MGNPGDYLERELRKARRAMKPSRVLARFISGGRHQSLRGFARSYGKQVGPTYRMADEARLTAAQRAVPLSERGRGGGKKPAGKRPDPYAAAKAIPARNRTQAVKQAAAAKKAAGGKQQQHVQGKDGKMRGSVTLQGADLTHYNAAKSGNAVIRYGEPGRRRW